MTMLKDMPMPLIFSDTGFCHTHALLESRCTR